MPEDSRTDPPLASYVLRVRGRPATLRYELHNVRSGDRRIFRSVDRLATYLRQHGLELGPAEPDRGGSDDPD